MSASKTIVIGLMLLSLPGCGQAANTPTLTVMPTIEAATAVLEPAPTDEIVSPEASPTTKAASPLDALAGTALQTTLLPVVLSPTTAIPTSTATNIAARTAATMPTATLTLTPEAPIPLPIATILESTSVSADDNFYIAVSNSLDWTNSPAPEGQRWIMLVATISNRSDHDQPVTRQQLRLVDGTGQRYLPETPDDSTIPPLVEITLKPDESVRGLVRYALPINAQAAALEWCLDAACNQRIESLIP